MAQYHALLFKKAWIVVQTIRYGKLDKNNDNETL